MLADTRIHVSPHAHPRSHLLRPGFINWGLSRSFQSSHPSGHVFSITQTSHSICMPRLICTNVYVYFGNFREGSRMSRILETRYKMSDRGTSLSVNSHGDCARNRDAALLSLYATVDVVTGTRSATEMGKILFG